ncbi:Uncharacterised protein [Escherichia coli]|nr:Uncharacterised protein [Escherichia coli]
MQPKKTPVIVVKKRRVLVMPENPVVNEKPQEVQKSAVNENKKVQKKDAVAEKTRKKQPQRKRLARTVLIFTERSDQLSRATDRVPGLPANPGYAQ